MKLYLINETSQKLKGDLKSRSAKPDYTGRNRSIPTIPTSLFIGAAIGLISAAPGVCVFSEEMLRHCCEAEAGCSRLAYFLAKVLCILS